MSSDAHGPKRRRWLLLALLGTALWALMVIVLLLRRSPPAGPVTNRAGPSPAAPSAPIGPMSVDPSAAAVDPGAQPTVPPPLPQAPFPYPPGSQPVLHGVDPATAEQEDVPVDPKQHIRLVFGARWDVVHPPDPIIIDLRLLDAAGRLLEVPGAMVRFRSDRATPDGPWTTAAAFADDGSGGDRFRGDRFYTATFSPSPSERALLLAGHRTFAEVALTAPDGSPRRYISSLMYTLPPGARFNGRFSEAVAGGSLIVKAGLAVSRTGQYKVIATLYGPDHETALVFAQERARLEPGDGTVPLTFFGKILHDRGVDGPYTLRYMMLFEEFSDQGAYLPGMTLDDAYRTKAYSAQDFSPAPYQAPLQPEAAVTADHPSQQGKPPPLFGSGQRSVPRGGTR